MKKYLFLLFISLVSCVFAFQFSEPTVYADNKASIVITGDLNEHEATDVPRDEITNVKECLKEEETVLKDKEHLPETGETKSTMLNIAGLILIVGLGYIYYKKHSE